jgi:hypothetical protein
LEAGGWEKKNGVALRAPRSASDCLANHVTAPTTGLGALAPWSSW